MSAGEVPALPWLKLKPMLCATGKPFDSAEFIYEVKWDGYRCLAFLDRGTRLQSRNLKDMTGLFPELSGLQAYFNGLPAVLDGEIVVFGEDGNPSFSGLQSRGRLKQAGRIKQAAQNNPALYLAFDLLYFKGRSLCPEPLSRRRQLLEENLQQTGPLLLSQMVEELGTAFYQACVARGLEGAVAKRKDSPYLPGKRSPYWQKFRHTFEDEFLVLGYEPGTGGRKIASLVLGQYLDGCLIYRGRVGTGWNEEEEACLLNGLKGLIKTSPPLQPLPLELKHPLWVDPPPICTVEYLELTAQGQLRHPVYRGLRFD